MGEIIPRNKRLSSTGLLPYFHELLRLHKHNSSVGCSWNLQHQKSPKSISEKSFYF